MRILLACALGCTTSLMVERMKQNASPDDVIEAHSVNEIQNIFTNYDVVILGPQVRLQFENIKTMCEKENVNDRYYSLWKNGWEESSGTGTVFD